MRCAAVLFVMLYAPPLHAQVACTVQHPGNRQTRICTVAITTTLQLIPQAQLSLSRSHTDLAGGSALDVQSFSAAADTGAVIVGPTLRVSASRSIAVTMVNAPQFTGPALKAASDVHLGVSTTPNLCTGVLMSPLSTLAQAAQQAAPRVILQTSAPTTDLTQQLCFRIWWHFESDAPGGYTLPLTFSITAP